MHFLIAIVLLIVQFSFIGDPSTDEWSVGQVVPGCAADEAGLQEGDQISSVGGEPVASFSDFRELHPELGPGEAVERELMLVTLKSPPETRSQVKQLADLYDAEVLDVGVDSMTISLDAEPGRIDDFEELCRPYGIVTVQRTGRVALPVLTKAAR